MTELETKLINIVKSMQSRQETLLQVLNATGEELESLKNSVADLTKNQDSLETLLGGYTEQLLSLDKKISELLDLYSE